jgi:MFS family permease
LRATVAVPALTAVFALNGFMLAQAVSRMPALRDQVDASPGRLGFALLASGVGSIVAMPWTARVAERYGSPRVVAVAASTAMLAWAALCVVPDATWLTVNLFIIGMCIGVWDVAMNVQGHTLEHRLKRVLMPRLHAGFSAGTVAGALTGAALAFLGVSLRGQLPAVSALGLVAVAVCVRRLIPDAAPGRASRTAATPAPRAGVTGVEIVLGILTFATALGEGAANDWLALVLVDDRGAAPAVGALTFAAFNVAMTIGRLAGGKVIARRGRTVVLRVCGATAVIGVLLVALVPSLGAAVVGGLLWGVGLSVVFPAAMSAAGEVPGRGSRAIGVVSTIGFAGFLAGAPTIGLVAERVGLANALLVVALVCSLVFLLAGAARERSTN